MPPISSILRQSWAQMVNTVIGWGLLFLPAVLGYSGTPLSKIDRGFGPLVGSLSVLAITRICRGLRWGTPLFALGLILGPWFVDGPLAGKVITAAAGVVAAVLAPIGHHPQREFGNGWLTLLPHPALPGWKGGKAQDLR